MNISVWPGSSSFAAVSASYYTGSSTIKPTPFGYYDGDAQFKSEADSVSDWCAKRLGYPISQVELQDVNFYACFEESVTEFGSLVSMYNAKDYMISLIGTPTASNLQNRVITPSMGRTIELAKNYGSEAGSGGNVNYKKGYIELEPNKVTYDLDVLWANISESGNRIEVKRVFHDVTPAISRYFDPYVGTGGGTQQMLDSFGWGSYSPAVSFLVMPIYADLLRMQAIELNDTIRKSSFSFELRNNKLTVYPIPTVGVRMWFEYIVVEERDNPLKIQETGLVSDLANVPFSRLTYSFINPIGKQWIYKYTLANSKELQGIIRSKYSTVPIPGSEVTLNGTDLIAQGREDKVTLMTDLKELLQSMTRQGQMEQETAIGTAMQSNLSKVPLKIYIK
jgi:hypothetical protein